MEHRGKLELTWVGKYEEQVIEPRILVEDRKKSYGDPRCENMLIHGDNLIALQALQQDFAGRIKCIYIDPPYNTGSAFEQYDDNVEHSIWLSLMRSRLKLLWNLLSTDGSIWISIDDNEEAYLRVLCDELFGRTHFVSNISWQRTYSTRNDAKGIVNEVEHILVYSREEGWQPNRLPRTAEMDKKYKNPDGDVGPWRSDNPYAADANTHQGMVYAIQHPFTGALLYPTPSSHWRYSQDEMLSQMNGWCPYELQEIDDITKRAEICGVSASEVRKGVKAIVLSLPLEESQKLAKEVLKKGPWPKFYFSKNGQGGIARKTYLSAVGDVPPTNLFLYQDVGHTDEAKKEILKLFSSSPFATPKPERLIARILTLASNPGDLILDSFLGSGTTVAVAHKMGRRWIGIELGEHAYTHCKVRMDKVVDGEQSGVSKTFKWHGGGGYHFYELAPSLLVRNPKLPIYQINPEYTFEMLCEAICKIEGFRYQPEGVFHGHSSEKRFIHITKEFVNAEYVKSVSTALGEDQSLLIYGTAIQSDMILPDNIEVRKIPKDLLAKCSFESEER